MTQPTPARVVHVLLDRYGQTYADQAGIRLANQPAPLFQLLCLSLLLSARIGAGIGVSAARALTDAGWTAPEAMAGSTWQARVQTLNTSGYARYDERTATMLGTTSTLLIERYQGDLRRLREEARHSASREVRLLQQFSGIGPVGSAIFAREVQIVWDELLPYADEKALSVAERLGLGSDPRSLYEQVPDATRFTSLVAALVRCGLSKGIDDVRRAAR